MNTITTIGILGLAALLEAGGDALVRKGIQTASPARIAFFLAGAAVLFAYGYTVNVPPWDFGRLLGVYVVFFFLVAQMINWLAFGHAPSTRVLVGGLCIVAGGWIIASPLGS